MSFKDMPEKKRSKIASKGGSRKVPKGTAITGNAKEIGSIGGKLGKRGYTMHRDETGNPYYINNVTGELLATE